MAGRNLIYHSAAQLLKAYRAQRFTPVEVVEALFARIENVEPRVNAWRLVDKRRARRQAQASAKRWAEGKPCGALDGVPVAIKDVTETSGWPTLNGSLAIDPAGPWRQDAVVVERFKSAGAVLIGKTETPEFAWLSMTESALHGVTRNPWNTDWHPCGSSGGSGAAVASGMVPIATGTDSGGSIRGPASVCNIVGFKPTFGRVPVWPMSPMLMMEHCGPLTRTVEDAALAFQVMAGDDARDGYALRAPAPDVLSDLHRGVRGLRIAFCEDPRVCRVDDDVRALTRAARKVFITLGARVANVKLDFSEFTAISDVICEPIAALLRKRLGPQAARLSNPVLIESADRGDTMSAVDFLEGEVARTRLRARLAAIHQRYDLLLVPTLGSGPFRAGSDRPPRWRASDGDFMAINTVFDLTGQPAISMPCGFNAAGGPIGVQIVGAFGNDALVLRAARAFERAHPVGKQHPPL